MNKEVQLNNMDVVMAALKLDSLQQPWNKYWELSQVDYPGEDLPFLREPYLLEANRLLMLPADAMDTLLQAAAEVRRSNLLSRFAWHCSYVLYRSEKNEGTEITFLPELEIMGRLAGMFPVLVLLSGLPQLIEFYEHKGIPEEILTDTLSDIKLCMEQYHAEHDIWKLHDMPWIYRHFQGKLYRLGRLQFEFYSFNGDLKVFRNQNTNKVIALSASGITYRGDGMVDGTNDVFDKAGAWVSMYESKNGYIVANPVLPCGAALKDTVKLSLSEWKPAFNKGDGMLNIHIPAGSRMDHSLCGESFSKAVEFFPRHFPEKPFKGFMCISWLLDPQFQKILLPSCNIVKFQKEYYLYPVLSNDIEVFRSVFGGKPEDLTRLPVGSSLQAAVKGHYLSGGHLQPGGMFLLKEDLNWGQEVYQSGKIYRKEDDSCRMDQSPSSMGFACGISWYVQGQGDP